MENRRYAIIGAGALGGLYGALLARSGADVHFLLRGDYEHVRSRGLRVDSIWGDFALERVNACNSPEAMPECNVVCVCLKTTENRLLPTLLRPLVRKGTVVLLMQNGLGAEEEVAAAFPEAKVGAGMCYLCSNRVGPGHIHHVDYGQVTFAPYSPGMDDDIKAVMADFDRAKVPVEDCPDVKTGRWMKLVWNIPFNGLSVVLGAGTDAIMSSPRTAGLAKALMLETIAGAKACGAQADPMYADWMIAFTSQMKPYKTSMVLDYEARRPLETEYLYRRPIEAAKRAGAEMPRVETLATLLEHLDQANRTSRR